MHRVTRRIFRCLFSLFVLLVASRSARLALAETTYKFTKIVETTSSQPIYLSPVVNASGAVAYGRHGIGGGIYRSQGGVTTKIADTSDGFSIFGSFDMNDSGTVVFKADLSAGGEGVFTGNGGAVATIASTATPSPMGGLFTDFGSHPSINDSGTVVIIGRAGDRRGIFKFDGALSTVVDDAGPLHEFDYDSSTINDAGIVGFRAAFDDRPNVQGVFASAGGGVTTIAEGKEYERLTASSLNNAGEVAFHVYNGAGFINDGIYSSDGGAVEVIAERMPNTGAAFGSRPSINAAGLVAFVSAHPDLGPGVFTGPSADKVIQNGDPLFGSTVFNLPGTGNVNMGSYSLNDAGQIAFTYYLANNRRGVALATPVPESSAFVLAGLAAGALINRHLRRQNCRRECRKVTRSN
jgi:hypothetical protein